MYEIQFLFKPNFHLSDGKQYHTWDGNQGKIMHWINNFCWNILQMIRWQSKLRITQVYDSRNCSLKTDWRIISSQEILFGRNFCYLPSWETETNWNCESPGPTKPHRVNCHKENERRSTALSDMDVAAINLYPSIPKSEVFGFWFSVSKVLRKKCINFDDQILWQNCVNH